MMSDCCGAEAYRTTRGVYDCYEEYECCECRKGCSVIENHIANVSKKDPQWPSEEEIDKETYLFADTFKGTRAAGYFGRVQGFEAGVKWIRERMGK